MQKKTQRSIKQYKSQGHCDFNLNKTCIINPFFFSFITTSHKKRQFYWQKKIVKRWKDIFDFTLILENFWLTLEWRTKKCFSIIKRFFLLPHSRVKHLLELKKNAYCRKDILKKYHLPSKCDGFAQSEILIFLFEAWLRRSW